MPNLPIFMEAWNYFKANNSKSALNCTDMIDSEAQRFQHISGFSKEITSLHILASPISSKKLKATDCESLVE